jgi:hypothetical protein
MKGRINLLDRLHLIQCHSLSAISRRYEKVGLLLCPVLKVAVSTTDLPHTMADPTAFYQPEEDELLSSLAVPAYQSGLETNYDDEYRRLQELEEHAYAQQAAAAEEIEQKQQLEQVPEDVKRVGYNIALANRVSFWSCSIRRYWRMICRASRRCTSLGGINLLR